MGGDSGMNWAVQTRLAILTMLLLSKQKGLTVHELETALGQEPQGLTHLLSKLEAQRWIDQAEEGSIRMTAEPGQVSLYQIIEAAEAPPTESAEENPRVMRLHETLRNLEKDAFSNVTLEELLSV
jgi:DNA-binding IscR family transcriptional regulator